MVDDGSSLFGFFGFGSVFFLFWRVCNVYFGLDVVEYFEELYRIISLKLVN